MFLATQPQIRDKELHIKLVMDTFPQIIDEKKAYCQHGICKKPAEGSEMGIWKFIENLYFWFSNVQASRFFTNTRPLATILKDHETTVHRNNRIA